MRSRGRLREPSERRGAAASANSFFWNRLETIVSPRSALRAGRALLTYEVARNEEAWTGNLKKDGLEERTLPEREGYFLPARDEPSACPTQHGHFLSQSAT